VTFKRNRKEEGGRGGRRRGREGVGGG